MDIKRLAERLVDKHGTRDPFRIATDLGYTIIYTPLVGVRGFYQYLKRCHIIYLDSELDDATARFVCAHELGHDVLHRELSEIGIREGTLFLETNRTELEANMFAACVLISDEELLDAVSDSADIEHAAAALCLPREIVKYKLTAMNVKGYNFAVGDIRNDFLK